MNAPRQNQAAPQIALHRPFPEDGKVAIIGGGMAGLACALGLAEAGVRATVFDTGMHGVGGRMATRTSRDASIRHTRNLPGPLLFDHAAQFFTATEAGFQSLVGAWLGEGVVREWPGRVAAVGLGSGCPVVEDFPCLGPKYIAPQGMRGLAKHILATACSVRDSSGSALVDLRAPCWVGRMEALGEQWALTEGHTKLGLYDAVVIAHNGKCANRLAVPCGSPRVARMLTSLRLSSIWALLVAVDSEALGPVPFEGAFVHGDPAIAWLGNNTAKLGSAKRTPQAALKGKGPRSSVGRMECWTIFSTPEYGKAHKVPQEAIPKEVAEQVTSDLLAAFQRALDLPRPPKPLWSRVQLWGAALPLNSPSTPSLLDPVARVGVCGDWLLGASLQDAVLSGQDLAQRLAALRGVPLDALGPHEAGLGVPLRPLANTSIGDFPGAEIPATKKIGKQQSAGLHSANRN